MISALTLSVCFLAAPAQAEPTPAVPQPMPEVFAGPESPQMLPSGADLSWHPHGPMDGMEGPNPYSCPHCSHRYPNGRPHLDWLISPCNMYPRIEYWPKDHGYYYFRPYNMVHVCIQRDLAASWGEDPRNPYDHQVFDRVYQALNAEEAAKAETLPPTQEKKPGEKAPPKQGSTSRPKIILRPAAITLGQ